VALSVTNLLLASMLFTAGLGVSLRDVRGIAQHPRLLAAGILANAIMPVVFLLLLSFLARAWPETEEAQSMLAGLALIGAMPVAGGASLWTQNADGNVPLTVGLVLGSTFLSPLSIPLALHAVSRLTVGDYSEDLAAIARDGTLTFSLLSVVIPCFLGIAVRHLAGEARVRALMPRVKVANLLVLLVLSYSNASGAMRAILTDPDYDMLALMFLFTALMCMSSFYVGFRIARGLRARDADVTSLTFGVGMNNSSASSVLASSQMADHPLVLIPILAYGMLQKVLAGSVDAALRRRREQHRLGQGVPPQGEK
jgi:BASS family bile acid:Na+ symporter